jgi:predicted GNAT family N-acyltransferase
MTSFTAQQLFDVQGTPCRMKMVTTAYEGMSVSYLRYKVFIEEQGVSLDEEFDGSDQVAVSFLMFLDHLPIGTIRFIKLNNTLQIGRIALLKPYRGKGYGKALMKWMEAYAQTVYPRSQLMLHAQTSVEPFYRKLGYVVTSEPFVEANIEHVEMIKTF